MNDDDFTSLIAFLDKVPAIGSIDSFSGDEDGLWNVKLTIDVDHDLAWKTVQELGHVLNYLSTEERLPTVFIPVSPPPYINGGPSDFLSWLIQNKESRFTPALVGEWLESRLPDPVEDEDNWS
jgi:hypothetical protein